jgi:UDP-N-acetylmuramoyl-L-alanyl-D-glutamate--2,6-diaminopimelate ligase
MSWQDLALAHLSQTSGTLSLDSRSLNSGDVFVALPGQDTDGRHYLAAVLALPSVLVLAEARDAAQFQAWREHPAVLWVADLRSQLSQLLHRWLDTAARRALTLLGVTGTNGKTSVSQFLAQALSSKAPCGVLGTLGQGLWPQLHATTNTTLDVISNHCLLAEFAHQGAQHAVMEVSSHALDQGRVDGLHFAVALFTNLSHDHLDYHGTMADYFAAKRQLFAPERAQQVAICVDDECGQQLAQWRSDALTVSSQAGARAAVAPKQVALLPAGMAVQWHTPWGDLATESALVGEFNVANLGLLIASLGLLGWSPTDIALQVSAVQPVAGRMQCITLPNNRLAIIDYAHTPDALAKALAAARQHTLGRLHCVFGCGGDRDRAKRAPMGQIAESQADVVWLTSDNNRSESFTEISTDVLSGMRQADHVQVIADRAQAIRAALAAMQAGDGVLIAGKGHELFQEEQGQRRPFSDLAQVQSCKETGV